MWARETRIVVTAGMCFLTSVTLSVNNIEHGCSALSNRSLPTLDRPAGKRRGRRQLFIPVQLLFIRQQRLFIGRSADGRPGG
ncbi:MAG: hypothetical protein ACRDT5_10905, partial [Mycobacterium sp.]